MLSVYLLCLGLGSSLILVSLFFGGADKDFDKDFDVDHDADVDLDGDADLDLDGDADLDLDGDADLDLDGDAEMELDGDAELDAEADGDLDKSLDADSPYWLPFLSMRFWTFGLSAFGLTGTMLSLLSFPTGIVAAIAALFGFGIGYAMALFFRRLKGDTVTATTSLSSYRGEEARVLLTIRPGGMGKVVIERSDGRVEMLARSEAGTIEPGSTVVVMAVVDGIAEVAPHVDEAAKKAKRALAAKKKRSAQRQ